MSDQDWEKPDVMLAPFEHQPSDTHARSCWLSVRANDKGRDLLARFFPRTNFDWMDHGFGDGSGMRYGATMNIKTAIEKNPPLDVAGIEPGNHSNALIFESTGLSALVIALNKAGAHVAIYRTTPEGSTYERVRLDDPEFLPSSAQSFPPENTNN